MLKQYALIIHILLLLSSIAIAVNIEPEDTSGFDTIKNLEFLDIKRLEFQTEERQIVIENQSTDEDNKLFWVKTIIQEAGSEESPQENLNAISEDIIPEEIPDNATDILSEEQAELELLEDPEAIVREFRGGTLIESLFRNLTPLQAKRVFYNVSQDKLLELELAAPEEKLTVETKNGDIFTLEFGRTNISNIQIYAQIQGETPVYLLATNLPRSLLNENIDTLRDKRIHSFTMNEVDKVKVSWEDEDHELVFVKSTNPEIASSWVVEGYADRQINQVPYIISSMFSMNSADLLKERIDQAILEEKYTFEDLTLKAEFFIQGEEVGFLKVASIKDIVVNDEGEEEEQLEYYGITEYEEYRFSISDTVITPILTNLNSALESIQAPSTADNEEDPVDAQEEADIIQ